MYKHFESKADLLLAYLQRWRKNGFERLEATINKVADRKQKLLAIFEYYHVSQVHVGYGGCRFVKANDEAGISDERVLAEIQSAKNDLKEFIARLVADSGHKQLLTDKELTELIFMMLEGGIVSSGIFKHAGDLQSAAAIIQKLI